MTQKLSLALLLPLLNLSLANNPAPTQSPVATLPADQEPKCNADSLPSDIRDPIKKDFASWRIKETPLLTEHAKSYWISKHLQTCPGIAIGLFQSSTLPSYAVLLVPANLPNSAYKLIVFTRPEGKPLYEHIEVERSDDPGASNDFIAKAILNDVFNEETRKKLNAQAPEAILIVDSSEQAPHTAIYFSTAAGWQHQPFDR